MARTAENIVVTRRFTLSVMRYSPACSVHSRCYSPSLPQSCSRNLCPESFSSTNQYPGQFWPLCCAVYSHSSTVWPRGCSISMRCTSFLSFSASSLPCATFDHCHTIIILCCTVRLTRVSSWSPRVLRWWITLDYNVSVLTTGGDPGGWSVPTLGNDYATSLRVSLSIYM